MESPSASAHRGLVPWQGLLLAISLLTFWSPPTTAQLSIVPTNAAEGKDVVLRIRNKPPDAVGFRCGREKVNSDGSMLLKRATRRDTGYYTVVAFLRNSKKEIGFGWLRVYQPVRVPTLLASNTTVTEHKDSVVLTCYTNAVSTQWFFNGMNLRLTERMNLSWKNRTLTIGPVRREDAGNYQCEVSNPISSAESAPVELEVKYK
ncbi:carcinoembryonic antigen-related cell adhesion molecule 21-like [Eptesicus fuscus]|uniref:carcinoembryonic antigen-related cell adhesion molecule 21-like n=1 Tax=Eptesicus fuscus TaxID=29078 RepID=UPI002403C40E|nr:carcinoembryonic antigen-related cell adhesion molecule 21-like [Eptesicus fuscus]